MRLGLLLSAAALIVASPAAAKWQQATSKHFVIYGDMPLEEMQDYARRLETFDAAARVVRAMKDPDVGDGNRVQVFVVPTMLDVNRIFGSAEAGIGGYYEGNVNGPFIITPRKARQILDYRKLEPETVFFHEYTHHLQLQNTNKPMPGWLTEGFAEFLANPIFNKDGSVMLGTPATHRAEYIVKGQFAPLPELLEGRIDKLGYNGDWFMIYPQGWLLNHYLIFQPSRRGQIDDYVNRISNGEDSLTAARHAFGDLGKLEDELGQYRHSKTFKSLRIDMTKVSIPTVAVSEMSAGASEVMKYRIYSKTGYKFLSSAKVLTEVRAIAARYPGDPIVLRTLAEVEYDNDNFDQAGKAADAAAKLDPKSVEPLLYKGRSLLGLAKKNNDQEMFKQARSLFIRANKMDHEDPEPLYLYYRSFRDANQQAPASAIDALNYAITLAPRDPYLQARLVDEYLRQNRIKEAATALLPIVYLPHLGLSRLNDARRALEMLKAGDIKGGRDLIEKELLPKLADDRA